MLKECPNCHGVFHRIKDHQYFCAYCGSLWEPRDEKIVRDVEWARNHYNEMANRDGLSDDLMAIVLLLQYSAKQTVFANAFQKYEEERKEKAKEKWWNKWKN